jgi:serine protease Do
VIRIAAAAIALLGAVPQDPESTAATLRSIRDKVAPSVVAIEAAWKNDPEGAGAGGGSGRQLDYYNRPAGPSTGVVLTPDGYILTCAFNVSGDLLRLTVITPDGRRHEAKRLGWDPKLDVALLKIEAKDLKPLPRAKIEDAKQGDFVCVVGRAPDPASPTINLGILSALRRKEDTAVQTDAEINYGNVGGPLVDLEGAILGVVSHVRPGHPWGQSGGVGFATRMAEIDKVLENLKKGVQVSEKEVKAPWIGIVAAEPPEGVKGVVVDQVLPGSPAEEAGLDSGDIITAVDGRPVESPDVLRTELLKKAAGVDRQLSIRRTVGAKVQELKVKIRPAAGAP